MSREEAIEVVQKLIGRFKSDSRTYKALEMAIQALSQEPTSEMVHAETLRQVMWERDIAIEQLHELGYELGQKIEPCDDAISREAAITIAGTHTLTVDETVKAIKNLPSVTQKSGKWIWSDEIDRYVCDKCGQSDGKDKEMVESGEYPLSNYCHNCGAKMESENKE